MSLAHKNKKLSKDTKKKISLSKKGKKLSEETKRKMSLAHKGQKITKETKNKLSLANRGQKRTNKTREKISLARTGMKHTNKTKEKMSLSHRGKKIGIENSNWKGGITSINKLIRSSLEYKLWRKSVFIRDNFICQKYGIKGGDLEAHHINNFLDFPELRLAIDNGITFSKKAHNEFHKRYGKRNNTKEQLEEFLV